RGIVGVSRYPSPEDPALAPREERTAPAAPAEGAPLEALASMIEAAAARSFDEVTAALGEPVRAPAVAPRRDAEPFEALRLRAAALAEEARAAIVLGVGDAGALAPRTECARDAFEGAGLRVRVGGAHAGAKEALAALPGAPSVVAPCADDESYARVMA